MTKNFKDITKLADKCAKKLKKEENVVSIVQIGSSLRREDFKSNSDLDFLVVYKNPVKRAMESADLFEIETNVLRYGKKQFIKSLEEGIPVSLIALKFGKVLYDKGFFNILRKKSFKPSEKTVERWIHTASFNLMDASMNYPLIACMCCYFKALHHAAREFCRAIILKEYCKLVEGDTATLRILRNSHPDLYQKFKLVIDGRKNYEKFKRKYKRALKISSYGTGKYLLAVEYIAIKALKIISGFNVPKINQVISELQKKYKTASYCSFNISPETKQMALHLDLGRNRFAFFTYDLEGGKLIGEKVFNRDKTLKL